MQNDREENKKKTVTARLESFKIKNGQIMITFSLEMVGCQVKSISLILRSQVKEKRYDFVFTTKKRGGKTLVRAQLPLKTVDWEQFYWDIRGVVQNDGGLLDLRIKNRSKFQKTLLFRI